MAIFSRTQIPKYQNPIRITRPYIKPNYLADTITSAIQGYGSIQNMNLQQQLFNAKVAQQQKQQQRYDATQAGLQHLGGNFGVPIPNPPSPPNALDDYLPTVNPYGTTTPTSLDSVRAAMQANPGADMSTLLNVAKAMTTLQAGPQLSWSQQMQLQNTIRRNARDQVTDARRDKSDAAKIIADFAARTRGNLKAGINEFGQGNVLDYQISPAGQTPIVFETEANKILASLLPRTQPYWADAEGKPSTAVGERGHPTGMTYVSPSKYEQAGGQQGWKMFVADHLSPLVEHLQKTTDWTDLQIQNEIGRVIQLGRAPQGQPGGAFNYRKVVSEIMQIMEGNTRRGSIPTSVANDIIRQPRSTQPVVY
jgi:hypothetical protein|tara:strand:- start:180 stop:1274 length:1095 start_codon:yes stop_codon:yes gene_type:complete